MVVVTRENSRMVYCMGHKLLSILHMVMKFLIISVSHALVMGNLMALLKIDLMKNNIKDFHIPCYIGVTGHRDLIFFS